jgi:anthranilate phosphoribosyltransferase
MPTPLETALRLLAERQDLTADQAAGAFDVIMRGEASPSLIAGLLMGLRAKGETADEIAGAATALRHAMVSVRPSAGPPVVDTCGTGGGAVSTFNVSTAAGFVAAGAGIRVAKHGNRSYTSKCGSADVLEAMGIDIGVAADRAAEVLDRAGMVFLFAPNYHPAMRHVGPTRKELGVATIMNLLGPLANPAGVGRQVIGVADVARAPLMAEALLRLGTEHALVVHGAVGMDEISPSGPTAIWEVCAGTVTRWTLDPADYGLEWTAVDDLAGDLPAANAARIQRLLEDPAAGPADESGWRAVVLNAAAAIYVAGEVEDFRAATDLAAESLGEGRAGQVLARLRGK